MTTTANAFNQYGRLLATGEGQTDEQAIADARFKAKEVIARGNPKYRIAKVRVHHDYTIPCQH